MTPRRCSCDRLPPPGVAYTTAYCRYCYLWHQRHPATAPVAESAPKKKPRKKRGPCIHRGRELTGHERRDAGKSHTRTWLYCEHPDRVSLGIAEAVCLCNCKRKCKGYTPRESDG